MSPSPERGAARPSCGPARPPPRSWRPRAPGALGPPSIARGRLLLGLLPALLLLGCPGPTQVEQERVEGHLLPPPDPSVVVRPPGLPADAVATAERALRVERLAPAQEAPADAVLPLLHMEGRLLRDILPSGLPRPSRAPGFHWSSAEPVPSWPFEGTVALPTGGETWLFAWVDRDGDASLSPGDPISGPVPPLAGLPSDAAVVLRLDRRYQLATPAELETLGPEIVVIDASAEVRARAGSEVLLSGYQSTEVSSMGLPDRPAPPTLRWSSGSQPLTWPLRVRLDPRGSRDIRLVAALDLDGDGVMSPGDLIGTPDCAGFPPPGAGNCTLVIDRPLPGPPTGP